MLNQPTRPRYPFGCPHAPDLLLIDTADIQVNVTVGILPLHVGWGAYVGQRTPVPEDLQPAQAFWLSSCRIRVNGSL